MSPGVDLSQFYETFFDEADELLADMEQSLLAVDIDNPDSNELNAIFRAVHSIKGGAGTFGCFEHLAGTTHLLENLLDELRHGEISLRKDMIDLFLETKDVLAAQVDAYRGDREPDAETYERCCARLRALAQQQGAPVTGAAAMPAPATTSPSQHVAAPSPEGSPYCVVVTNIVPKDAESLSAEMALLGRVVREDRGSDSLKIWLVTTADAADLEAVCCFIVNATQVSVSPGLPPVQSGLPQDLSTASLSAPISMSEGQPGAAVSPAPDLHASSVVAAPALSASPAARGPVADLAGSPAGDGSGRHAAKKVEKHGKESGTIRVGVEKVDQIINLVGELVITQAMLVQTASTLDPVVHDRLLQGIEQLERNARDMQESVMSIRMMPMDYVFSRFPRVVRENASWLGKRIRLTTHGQATELDKSLIERIIDPLTHLVRNSLDHGIELPEVREAAGKDPEGQLVLSAEQTGGQIVIEVSDDGAGLDRERILKKAMQLGLPVSANTPDDELWQLIFSPGFSTAEKVTEISGRGVGMDVVRRNIQSMGGHIQLSSRAGLGTTIRILLPLTLAILDGMSVQVGNEIYILPLSYVTESMQPTLEQLHGISETEHVLHVRGEYLPMVSLSCVFGVEGAQTEITKSIAIILQAEETRFALLVDSLVGQQQVVVKNLESNYRKIPGISAATILGDGSVALIVDVFALMRMTCGKSNAVGF
ncbi:MAG: chemotaxis protein CheA [Burkholderiaceae bacterium]|nr:MAG: chemotaxis protein CheA [Burkholderiaceae bacterium]TAM03228.1 MAG: chemotaxis protein CheA [Pusillimonas sp.]